MYTQSLNVQNEKGQQAASQPVSLENAELQRRFDARIDAYMRRDIEEHLWRTIHPPQ